MKARNYKIDITGATPLLLHRDNIEWADRMQQWGKDPANKKVSVAGDDRTPAFRWIGCLYVNSGLLTVDSDQLMTMLREGGAMCPVGKGAKTYKRQTQSSLLVNEVGWPIRVGDDKLIPYDRVAAPNAPLVVADLLKESDFEKHCAAASSLGFSLFCKRASVGDAKHLRVRPRFDTWSISGTITCLTDDISEATLRLILTQAGASCGLGDWRPSAPKSPGPFGRFTVTVTPI